MPEHLSRLSEFKERLQVVSDIELDDTPRFSSEGAPDKEIQPITISSKEQIRYQENEAFSEVVYDTLQDGLAKRIRRLEEVLSSLKERA